MKICLLTILFTIIRTNQVFTTNLNSKQIDILMRPKEKSTLNLGICDIVISGDCPDPDISFFLYSRTNQHNGEGIYVGNSLKESNLTKTKFNPFLATKILIHGYNSDMNLEGLNQIKHEYFLRRNLNIILVDWSALARGPCYPAAVWNTKFVGKCLAQLIHRIWDTGTEDIHLIGFSLGAHVSGLSRNYVLPKKIKRITGLDPAMPGFTTVSNENKLDASDAEFVDIIHTNAFLQGTVEQSGHLDFYVNGGVIQPGCWAESRFLACNHHRSALYFAESINTRTGFWGWPCVSYIGYLMGFCPPMDPQILMGEYAEKGAKGVYLVITNSVSPFAVGKYTGPLIEIVKSNQDYFIKKKTDCFEQASS